jgi:hypothetical protein
MVKPALLKSGTEYWDNGEKISYEQAVERQNDAWVALISDPEVVDVIGVVETVDLAREQFSEIVKDYFPVWADQTKGDSSEFAEWLEQLSQSVGEEVGSLWRNSEWHAAWFARACRPKVDDVLSELASKEGQRARSFEIKHLENPQLSLAEIVEVRGYLDCLRFDWRNRPARSADERNRLEQVKSQEIAEPHDVPFIPMATASERVVEGGANITNQAGSTELSGAEANCTEAGPPVNKPNANGADRRATIDAFISKLAEAGREVTRKDIWIAAGYKDATEFERFQRGDSRTTRSAAAAFNRVLALQPKSFIELLDKKSTVK